MLFQSFEPKQNRIRFLVLISTLCLSLGACIPKRALRPTDVGPLASTDSDPADTGPLANLVILGTNDIHGALLPVALKSRESEGVPQVSYEAGGAAYFASQLDTLRGEYGDQLIWLDAGDYLQGTLESHTTQGATVVEVFNALGLGAAALGNREFDFGLGALQSRLREARYPTLAANFYTSGSGPAGVTPSFENLTRSKLLAAGAISVGVIGLATPETPTTTRPEMVRNFEFGDLKDAVLRESQSLRSRGAHAIVLVGHAGIRCEFGRVSPGYKLRRISDPQGECESHDEAVRLLKSLPSGTVDAFVTGHSHTVVHHWVAGVPVIQSGAGLRYFSLVHLKVDLKHRRSLPNRTVIEGPVPVCPAIFANQGDCNGDRPAPAAGRGELITPVFHDRKVKEDRSIREMIAPAKQAAAEIRKRPVALLPDSLDHVRRGESPLGNLVADALRYAAKSDFALINSGGVRAPLEKGTVTAGDLFRTLPFENSIVKITLSGAQLKTLLGIAESGSRGFFPVSGLKLKLIHADSDAPSKDLDQDEVVDPWEIHRLLDVKSAAGAKIVDSATYTLATVDFLALGGDDLKWATDQIAAKNKVAMDLTVRQAVHDYLAQRYPTAGKPDPTVISFAQDGPRFALDKTKGRSKTRTRRRSKKR